MMSTESLTYAQRHYRYKKATGICVVTGCKHPAKPGKATCKAHIDRQVKFIKKYRDQKKADGLCIEWNCPEKAWGTIYCQSHREKRFKPKPGSVPYAVQRVENEKKWQVELKAANEVRERAKRILAQFYFADHRAADFCRMYYGLNGGVPMTLAAIGEQHGITRERVRQIIKPFRRSADALGLYSARRTFGG